MLLIVVHLLLLRRRSDHGLLAESLWWRTDHWVVPRHHVNVRRASHEGIWLAIDVHGLVSTRVELAWRGSHELLLAWLTELGLLHEGRLLRDKLRGWLSWKLSISGIRNSRIRGRRSKPT